MTAEKKLFYLLNLSASTEVQEYNDVAAQNNEILQRTKGLNSVAKSMPRFVFC